MNIENENKTELLPTFYDLASVTKLIIVFAAAKEENEVIKNIVYNGIFLYSIIRVLDNIDELKQSGYSKDGIKDFDSSMARGLFFFVIVIIKPFYNIY